MRFAHYLEQFTDDEGFLQTTYQAGLQVERLKALEKARESTRPSQTEDKKKDATSKDTWHTERKKEPQMENQGKKEFFGRKEV